MRLRRTSRVVRLLAVAAVAPTLAAGSAAAAPMWHPPEPIPAGLDASHADAVVLPDGSTAYVVRKDEGTAVRRRLVRRAAGGASTVVSDPFPAPFGGRGSANPILSQPAANGDLLAIDFRHSAAVFVPGGGGALGALEQLTEFSAFDAAPSGAAVAIVGPSDAGEVAFRPAGAAGRFDDASGRVLQLATGDTRAETVGIVLDPDGGVFVVYKSLPSKAILQTYAPPGGDFQTPAQVPTPLGDVDSNMRFASSTNGYAVLVWGAYASAGAGVTRKVVAAIRPPGGLLGSPSTAADHSSDSKLNVASPRRPAIDSGGTAYVPYGAAGNPSGCPSNNDNDAGAFIAIGAGSGWTVSPLGPNTWPSTSFVADIDTAGPNVVVAIGKINDTGARCTESQAESTLVARIGAGGALGGEATIAHHPAEAPSYATIQSLSIGTNGNAVAIADNGLGGGPHLVAYEDRDPPPGGGPGPDPGGGDPGPGPGPGPGGDPGPPAPLPVPGSIRAGGTIKIDGKLLPFKVECRPLRHSGICQVRAELTGFFAPRRVLPARGKAKRVRFGSLRATVPAGKTKTLKLRLSKRARAQLRRRRSMKAKLTVKITQGDAKTTVTRNVKLVLKRKKR